MAYVTAALCSGCTDGRPDMYVMMLTGASTPYKRWSKCTVEKVRGEGFCTNLGEISLLIIALISSAN